MAVAALAAPLAATANAAPEKSTGVEQATPGYWCVSTNNVNYRRGPGDRYKSDGQVHKGQGGNVRRANVPADNTADGTLWDNVDLWGGKSNTWIRGDFIVWCA